MRVIILQPALVGKRSDIELILILETIIISNITVSQNLFMLAEPIMVKIRLNNKAFLAIISTVKFRGAPVVR